MATDTAWSASHRPHLCDRIGNESDTITSNQRELSTTTIALKTSARKFHYPKNEQLEALAVQNFVMGRFSFTFSLICLIGYGWTTNGECLQTGEGQCSPSPILLPLSPLQELQGKWEGYDVGDESRQKILLTIKDKQLHFFRDEDFWFKTTFTLSLDKKPLQLHATIKESADGDTDGEVVDAIFKIEKGIFKLASFGPDNQDPPKSFDRYPSHYVLKKVCPEEKAAEEEENGSGDD